MGAPRKAAMEPDPIDEHVGRQIRVRRKLLSLSQSTLADAIGVSFQQVQKYERGINRVSASTMARIAKHLGCRSSDLLPAEDCGEKPAQLDLAFLSAPGGVELARAFLRLSPKLRRSVVELARGLAAEDP